MEIAILEIYKKYNIPSNLQNHMLTATAMAKILCENWIGPSVNMDDIITTMLIHDIGNIAKMDFSAQNTLPEENKNINFWQNVQQEFIRKYGADDHIATFNVASELGLKPRILWLVINKIFVHNELIAASSDYELKICAYSDQRTGPQGIVPLRDRFKELKIRYRNRPNASINHPRIKYLIESAYKIEKQVLKFTSLRSSSITKNMVADKMKEVIEYAIRVN
ncbi:MAG: hypothetical protein QXN36_00100 [Candidatus Bathyarchaeia archaeon]